VNKTHVDLAKERGRGIEALKGTTVPAVFCDAVKVQLKECIMLFVSGKIGVKPDGTLAGRTMREQTQQVLENIRDVLQREGATMDDIVRVRVYATQVDAASLRDIHEVRSKFWTEGKYPASTLVRVDQLIRDGALIEIDADAVIAA
jgi:2-iminobutanoate/2-iminopropanoate deaminase